MDIQFIDEHTLLIFFVQIFLLLLLARGMGELFAKINLPEVAGEIIAGLILGKLIFGKFWPSLHGSLFPDSEGLFYMLETLSWLGVLFLLLIAGLEIDLSNVVKHQKSLIIASFTTLGVPVLIGSAWAFIFGKAILPENTSLWIFSIFIGLSLGIAAVPVIAKILHDMNMLKSDVGFLALSIATVGDLIGWTIFTVILGLRIEDNVRFLPAFKMILFTVLFIWFSLTLGRKIVNFLIQKIAQSNLPKTKSMLTFVFLLSLFMGTITQWIGIHGLFGFFIAGIILGEASYLDESAKENIKQVIFAFFAPIFFANIGLKIDLTHGFDVSLVLILLVIAMGGKFLGGFLGTRWGGLARDDALLAGAALSPGGAMEIVLALLALEYNIINMKIFVAIVLMAIISSVLAGPLMSWLAKKKKLVSIATYFKPELFLSDCSSDSKEETLKILCQLVSEKIPVISFQKLYDDVLKREKMLSTGLERGLAIPHVRIKDLKEPVVVYAYHEKGVDWNSLDGLPAHHIFFIVTPEDDPGYQTRIISRLAGLWHKKDFIKKMQETKKFEDFIKVLNNFLVQLEKNMKE